MPQSSSGGGGITLLAATAAARGKAAKRASERTVRSGENEPWRANERTRISRASKLKPRVGGKRAHTHTHTGYSSSQTKASAQLLSQHTNRPTRSLTTGLNLWQQRRQCKRAQRTHLAAAGREEARVDERGETAPLLLLPPRESCSRRRRQTGRQTGGPTHRRTDGQKHTLCVSECTLTVRCC